MERARKIHTFVHEHIQLNYKVQLPPAVSLLVFALVVAGGFEGSLARPWFGVLVFVAWSLPLLVVYTAADARVFSKTSLFILFVILVHCILFVLWRWAHWNKHRVRVHPLECAPLVGSQLSL